MAAPTFVGVGTYAEGTGAVTPALPAGWQAGDLLLVAVETANQAVPALSGYTELASSPQGTGTAATDAGTRLTIYYKIATSGETAPTVGDSGDHQLAQISAWRGVDQTTPINATAGDVQATAQQAFTIPGLTTTVADCMVVALVTQSRDIGVGANNTQFSGWANASLASITEFTDTSTAFGTGGGIGGAYGVKAASGAVDPTTGTLANTGGFPQGRIALAIAPVASGGSTPISGTGTTTFQPATSTATGQLAVKGSAASTFAAMTGVGAGRIAIVGVAASTFAPTTGAGAGVVRIAAQGAGAFRALTSAATGRLSITGTGAASFAAMSSAASGQARIAGTGVVTFQPMTAQASGALEAVSGAHGSATFAAMTGQGAGLISLRGAGVGSFAPMSSASVGELAIQGVQLSSFGAMTALGAGRLAITGSGLASFGPMTGYGNNYAQNFETPPERQVIAPADSLRSLFAPSDRVRYSVAPSDLSRHFAAP